MNVLILSEGCLVNHWNSHKLSSYQTESIPIHRPESPFHGCSFLGRNIFNESSHPTESSCTCLKDTVVLALLGRPRSIYNDLT